MTPVNKIQSKITIKELYQPGVALGKGEVGDCPRPHLKIQKILRPLLKSLNIFIYKKN
jgi:hypothetical protein